MTECIVCQILILVIKRPKRPVLLTWSQQIHSVLWVFLILNLFYFQYKIYASTIFGVGAYGIIQNTCTLAIYTHFNCIV